MKNIILSLALLLVVSVSANAALVNNGDGTITDTDTNLMWLLDANYANTSGYDDLLYGADFNGRMYWSDAVDWANQLVFADYDDWRLPITFDQTCQGFCTNSEMGILYNTGTSDFQNLQTLEYWSGTEVNTNYAWYVNFFNGYQGGSYKTSSMYNAMAVRVVPEPISSTLFIVGGATLGFRRFRKKFNR
jgi:hypothetical protein